MYKGSRSYTHGIWVVKMWCSIEEYREQEKNYVVGVPRNFLETYDIRTIKKTQIDLCRVLI